MSEVFAVVDGELGANRSVDDTLRQCVSFLYIGPKKSVLGCVIIRSLSVAFKAEFSADSGVVRAMDDSVPIPVRIGIEKLWVHPCVRNQPVLYIRQ